MCLLALLAAVAVAAVQASEHSGRLPPVVFLHLSDIHFSVNTHGERHMIAGSLYEHSAVCSRPEGSTSPHPGTRQPTQSPPPRFLPALAQASTGAPLATARATRRCGPASWCRGWAPLQRCW